MAVVASQTPISTSAPWPLVQRLFDALPGQWTLKEHVARPWVGFRAVREDGLTLDGVPLPNGVCHLAPGFRSGKRFVALAFGESVQLKARAASLSAAKGIVRAATRDLAARQTATTQTIEARSGLAKALAPLLGKPTGNASSERAMRFSPVQLRPGIWLRALLDDELLRIEIEVKPTQALRTASAVALATRTDLSGHKRAEIVRDLSNDA